MSCVLDSMKVVMLRNNEDLESLVEHLQEPHSINVKFVTSSDRFCSELIQLLSVASIIEECKLSFLSLTLKCYTFLLFCQLLLTSVLQVSNSLLVFRILHYFK